MTDTTAARKIAQNTTFAVLFAIGFCHLLNDMMQALLPAIYPTLKQRFHLNFAQIGLVTLAFNAPLRCCSRWWAISPTRSPCPIRWRRRMVSTLLGLLVLSIAGTIGAVLICAMVIGWVRRSSIPNPSRVARMASGGRHGLAQSVFQVGGNTGQALRPLTAAALVATLWPAQHRLVCGLLALLGIIVLYQCRHLVQASRPGQRMHQPQASRISNLPPMQDHGCR